MTDSAPSPKRRHILSSINAETRDGPDKATQVCQDEVHRDRNAATDSTARETRKSREVERGDDQEENDTTRPRRSRLKLKSEKSRRRRHRSRDKHDKHDQYGSHGRRDYQESSSDFQTSSRRHRRHRHRERSPTPPNPHEPPPLDPEAAFRESLFDAMADDEGASYWESVYGQPIHVYGNEKVGPGGELEQMTEDEYASYVRQKMWEKTHAGLLEEKAKREESRRQKKAEEERARKLRREMDQSLRRGEERRQKRRWAAQWEEYTRVWASWDSTPEALAWPVDGNERKKITEKDVRSFYIYGLDLESVGEREFASRLKEERVKWHPDKMQQRLGGKVDDEIMRNVTAVFQIIDRMWADVRPRA